MCWFWSLSWIRNLFAWEEEEYEKLLRYLHGSSPKQNIVDSWTWIYDISGQYWVRNAYQTLHEVEESRVLAFFKSLGVVKRAVKDKAFSVEN
ncbi:hypothetical protein Lalb_Chr21g0313431 [Lupinus albus]|uniref:Uncharacterized protein n=1 Tax=Lupinus albus TaxID=3870 RepID=A0A6A4ND10_LUPAL|nr:hypothetical protein Lalb_Chr21g0313431 [Lupinus albus]